MEVVILLAIVAALPVAVGFGFILRKLARGPQTLPVTAEWIDQLSVERYRPMLRLLNEEDLAFLSSQPGFTPRMVRRFRAQRCQVFRGYLNWLQADFERVCTALRIVMVNSQHDRPDLAAFLLRQRAIFAAGMVSLKFRLWLFRWGVGGVEVDSVMGAFNSLRFELRQLVPAAGRAAA